MKINKKKKLKRYKKRIEWREYLKKVSITFGKGLIGYNKSIEEVNFLNEENEAFLIRPSRYIKMKRVEKDEKILAQMYNLGVSDMQEKIEELKKYLKEKND